MPERAKLRSATLAIPLAEFARAGGGEGIELVWLGQAGFIIRSKDVAFAIDPYLSGSLGRKYAGSATPHDRMMKVPVAPEALIGLDIVLCTHHHTDHMDPETLSALFGSNRKAVLVAPRAAAARVREAGIPEARTCLVNAGDTFDLAGGAGLRVLSSAHEGLDRDENGDFLCLGYALTADGMTVYHSGDCVPYDGLNEAAASLAADLALLPVNGRRPELAARGIPGNFTPAEAAELCRFAGIPNLVIHHFGMFALNSADPQAALAEIRRTAPKLNVLSAASDTVFALVPEP